MSHFSLFQVCKSIIDWGTLIVKCFGYFISTNFASNLSAMSRTLCFSIWCPFWTPKECCTFASSHCARCGGQLETIPHLLWTCSSTTTFIQRISAFLYHRFLAEGLGNTFGYLDKFRAPYLAMPIFSNGQDFGHLARNNRVFHGNQQHEVTFCKQSLRQSLFDCLQLRDITLQMYNLYFQYF